MILKLGFDQWRYCRPLLTAGTTIPPSMDTVVQTYISSIGVLVPWVVLTRCLQFYYSSPFHQGSMIQRHLRLALWSLQSAVTLFCKLCINIYVFHKLCLRKKWSERHKWVLTNNKSIAELTQRPHALSVSVWKSEQPNKVTWCHSVQFFRVKHK